VLDRAARLVKPDGRIVYITCSILPEENDDALSAFMENHAGFTPVSLDRALDETQLGHLRNVVRPTAHGLQLTPHKTGTDGFYVAILVRNP
jgi:16S rRNA (cytosine967-C5)-methyltransferase